MWTLLNWDGELKVIMLKVASDHFCSGSVKEDSPSHLPPSCAYSSIITTSLLQHELTVGISISSKM